MNGKFKKKHYINVEYRVPMPETDTKILHTPKKYNNTGYEYREVEEKTETPE